MHSLSRLGALGLLAAAAGVAAASGTTSVLYAINAAEYGNASGLDRIQANSTLSRTNTGDPYDYALAVSGDARTVGFNLAYPTGSLFSLGGSLSTLHAYTRTSTDDFYDGASDGKHSYAVSLTTGKVMQFDANWGSQTTLFTVATGATYSGITVNAADGSFWLGNYSSGRIEHYTHGGSLLGSFATTFGGNSLGGLAFDPADGTIWATSLQLNHFLIQYDQSGVVQQAMSLSGNGNSYVGLEFNNPAPAPEPASMAALAVGALGLLRRRRKPAA